MPLGARSGGRCRVAHALAPGPERPGARIQNMRASPTNAPGLCVVLTAQAEASAPDSKRFTGHTALRLPSSAISPLALVDISCFFCRS